MALFVNQESNRTKLQEKLAAELQEKAKQTAGAAGRDRPDGVEDSAYMEGTKKTTSIAWLWVLVVLVALGAVIWLAIVSLNRK